MEEVHNVDRNGFDFWVPFLESFLYFSRTDFANEKPRIVIHKCIIMLLVNQESVFAIGITAAITRMSFEFSNSES